MAVTLSLGDTRLILAACRKRGVLRNQAAYILATAKWETAHTMKPVVEAFWLSEDWRRRNLRYYPWHGRGYVQLTWKDNYQRASKEIGVDMTSDPNVALRPEVAAEVLICGTMEGWFTGKKLSDYVTLQRSDYKGARRVVNGTDKAAQIAALAVEYEAAIKAEGYGDKPAAIAKPAAAPKLLNAWTALVNAFRRLFKGA